MAERLTEQQEQAVNDRGGELLVSAAAGSGKTKVLVDRLMRYLTDPDDPADLDSFLIITFTKAAAAELRGKIAAKLTEHISQNPNNRHLQQQLQRLYLTNISTVHSFCTEIIREYAYKLDISADFRVAEESECAEIRHNVLQRLLDENYETEDVDPDFYALIESQGFGRDDSRIPEIVEKVYDNARCHLNPDAWLEWCVEVTDTTKVSDVSETVWGAYLIQDFHNYLDQQIYALDRCAMQAEEADHMESAAKVLADNVALLKNLRNCTKWNEIYMNRDLEYGTLRFSNKCTDQELISRIKLIRNACKKGVASKLRSFSESSEQAFAGIAESGAAARALVRLVRQFSQAYDQYKQRRRILDFGDLEHRALDLLLGKDRKSRTYLADEIGSRFREVMVDEYQDSNEVQDAIYNALTQRRHNCFMVGDVKQSIYQFRQADPGIFLDKYNRYVLAQNAEAGQGRKVLLSSNFRSATAVIEAVNDVFGLCMSQRVGGLDYGDAEKLNEGLEHIPVDEPEVEFYGIDVQKSTYAEEATFVANRISQLLDGTHMVREKDTLRPIIPDDIVILLRSPATSGPAIMKALDKKGIRSSIGGGMDLLSSEEISVLRSMLQVIHNPMQDIPLLAALTSRVFCFTADDLAEFRSANRDCSLYEVLLQFDSEKVRSFLELLKTLRQEARMNSISALLAKVFALTRIDSIYGAMLRGEVKVENLQAFCQIAATLEANGAGSLGQFLAHLDALENKGLLSGSETRDTGAVTLMSIHKSKGLEFPVVFLCATSRNFNRDNSRAAVMCDKEFGLGLSCVDTRNRVRYPTVSKRAISAKIAADDQSEEMRVLYVALTRAKDRLIMTYAVQGLEAELYATAQFMQMYSPEALTAQAICPGEWLLMTALRRREADKFFAFADMPDSFSPYEMKWHIDIVRADDREGSALVAPEAEERTIPAVDFSKLEAGLSFRYPYDAATRAPSKQTATQLKGRHKDNETAEDTPMTGKFRSWRVPSFIAEHSRATDYGTIVHRVMQHIRYEACTDATGVEQELRRLAQEGYIPDAYCTMIPSWQIAAFFETDAGRLARSCRDILREFKFSVLDDATNYGADLEGERVLLQGVVDCAIVEDDGITVIDFKTDRVTDETLKAVSEGYRDQITAYANALSRIYEKPIKKSLLYFFRLGRTVQM